MSCQQQQSLTSMLNLGKEGERHTLRIGDSFLNKDSRAASCYHTIKYDFKPASMDPTKTATMNVGESNEVVVTVPHSEGSGASTVFKGSKKPYQKECVLIIDRATGEIVLEKLSSNMQLKKTRQEGSSRVHPRPVTPVDPVLSRFNSPNKASPGGPTPGSPGKNSSPPNLMMQRSPNHHKSSPSRLPPSHHHPKAQSTRSPPTKSDFNIGHLSASSSSSDNELSDMEIDNQPAAVSCSKPPVAKAVPAAPSRAPVQHKSSAGFNSHFSQLDQDLQLSESGSDSN